MPEFNEGLKKDYFGPAGRSSHREDTVIEINEVKVGGGDLAIIAGPCSVESREQILNIADEIKDTGACILRGGAFKPRTSPYNFQGLGEEGLRYLSEAGRASGLPVISEITGICQIDLFGDIDIIQVGARNMQNFELLKEVGRLGKPVLIKRGFSNTLRELLFAADYVMNEGNPNVILCERGIRTFETYTRNTLDLSAVPVLKKLTHLPVIVDPSHATGRSEFVEPMALAAVAAGADGIMIEVHDDPVHSVTDGRQAIDPEAFMRLVSRARAVRAALKEE